MCGQGTGGRATAEIKALVLFILQSSTLVVAISLSSALPSYYPYVGISLHAETLGVVPGRLLPLATGQGLQEARKDKKCPAGRDWPQHSIEDFLYVVRPGLAGMVFSPVEGLYSTALECSWSTK